MPELPETETIARDLDGALRGAVIHSVRVIRGDVLRDPRVGGRALVGAARTRCAASLVTALTDATIVQVHRRAKSIVIALDAGGATLRLVATPRFTGALLIGTTDANPYDCLMLALTDARTLTYRDQRRLGTLTLLRADDFDSWTAALGPEPLDPDLTPERFSQILRRSSRAVKTVLMDQRRLAGVGNIYANEACWRAGIRPARRARAVTRVQAVSLLEELRTVLTESIALRGTTFRDFQDAYGGKGGFAAKLAVYGRGGLPCPRCGAALSETHKIEGRSTVWCRACQR